MAKKGERQTGSGKIELNLRGVSIDKRKKLSNSLLEVSVVYTPDAIEYKQARPDNDASGLCLSVY